MAKYGPLSWENKSLLSVLRTVNEKSLSGDVFWHRLNFQHVSDPVGFSWECWHEEKSVWLTCFTGLGAYYTFKISSQVSSLFLWWCFVCAEL